MRHTSKVMPPAATHPIFIILRACLRIRWLRIFRGGTSMKQLVVLLLCCGGAFAQSRTAVVITETSDWKTSPTTGGHSESHLADVTLEMSRSCPDVVVTTDSSKAQFGLRIDHQQRDANNGVLALFDKPYTYIVYS